MIKAQVIVMTVGVTAMEMLRGNTFEHHRLLIDNLMVWVYDNKTYVQLVTDEDFTVVRELEVPESLLQEIRLLLSAEQIEDRIGKLVADQMPQIEEDLLIE
ncbi:MAG: hypothetical protein A3E36_04540 [Candidatus Andersenbacteria bacterium RIFCSPHIGHO2_12_FULL_45_11b]|uniref:Uncharacterized protein n=1 Tax=Candidatus Andersenbacteria bacterium RIFCSPHIGHO2_12_FULL_45_11b TaxID=1797282 RepID=A0A1G1XCD0_9BACT|nr:MAG: hypothetical protein A3E36_04540 [Candidatus Andersenbacteria bacterium RIFCSPHIGHO2_12_FULL_45_11b]